MQISKTFAEYKTLFFNVPILQSAVVPMKQQTLPKIKIEVYENGNLIKKLTTDRDGKAYQNFELNREYDIKINPGGGMYIQKWVKLDTRNIDLHAWKFKNRKEFRYYYQIEINLFEPERCEQFAFLDQQPIINPDLSGSIMVKN